MRYPKQLGNSIAVNIISSDQTTTIELLNAEMWLLNAGVNLAIENNANAGFFGTGVLNSLIQLYGHIFASTSGVSFTEESHGNAIYIGADGTVFSSISAIEMFGDSNSVVNDGSIDSWAGVGVSLEGDFNVITNRGDMTGFLAAATVSGHGNTIENYGTMSISSFSPANNPEPAAIHLASAADTQNFVKNFGSITSLYYAILGGDGNEYVENLGQISGKIALGAGNDVLDNSDGVIRGDIDLGDGDDFYLAGTNEYLNAIVGGAGNDTYALQGRVRQIVEDVGGGTEDRVFIDVTATLTQNVEILFLYGSADINGTGNALDNTITGTHGDNRLRGRGGNDRLLGAAGEDILHGGTGIDTAAYDFSDEGVSINLGKKTASGGHAEGDTFISIENLFGSEFADTLIGDTGFNQIYGGLGDDTIDGGRGNDMLVGGDGNDKFIFARKTGQDTVEDFTLSGINSDRIDVHSFKPKNFADLQNHMADNGANVEITYGKDVLTLVGIHKADLTSDHFIL